MTSTQIKESLTPYLPPASLDFCIDLITRFNINIKITHARLSKLGDYRHPHNGHTHRISINHNLNPFAFLITFIHEVAHLTTWNNHKNNVEPHGREWKTQFRLLLQPLLDQQIFPEDIHHALKSSLHNPSATSCADELLYKVLKRYDAKNNFQLLEDLPEGCHFVIKGYSNIFIKGKLLRKKFHCKMKDSRREFRVSAVAEVQQVTLF